MSKMQRSDFRFFEQLRVRWAEVDMQRIVFNGHYLMYFDTAVAGYWRALALPYAVTMEHLNGDLFVRKATLEYLGSARYDDLCDVGMRVARIGNSSISFVGAVFRGEQLLVHGELIYVFADPATQTSRPVPQPLRDVLLGFEAGEAMVEVRVGDWAELGAKAQDIRRAVFTDEQGFAAAMDQDEGDLGATHALAFNRFGLPLATGRLLTVAPRVGKIGRMAVVQNLRGSGIGKAVVQALMAQAQQLGLHEVILHTPPSTASFYMRQGFVQRGEAFHEAGISHLELARRP